MFVFESYAVKFKYLSLLSWQTFFFWNVNLTWSHVLTLIHIKRNIKLKLKSLISIKYTYSVKAIKSNDENPIILGLKICCAKKSGFAWVWSESLLSLFIYDCEWRRQGFAQRITSPLILVVRNGNIIQRRGCMTGRAEESPFRIAKWSLHLRGRPGMNPWRGKAHLELYRYKYLMII